MKVLSIGSDKNLLVKGSAVRARMEFYGRACVELHIIIPGLGEEEKIGENVFVHPTGTTNPLKRVSAAVTTGQKISGINLVTAQDPFEYGIAGLELGKILNMPVELQVHTDIGSPYFKKELKNKLRMVGVATRLKRASGVRVVSNRVANAVEKLGIPKEKISILPVYIDGQRFLNVTRTPSVNERVVLMVGRLEKEKDYPVALGAFARVHHLVPEARLHIAGDGRMQEELIAVAQKLGVADAVTFLGAVSDMTPHLAKAHVFLHTSRYEGFGAVLAEAALAGVPIVSTDVGIAGTILENGQHAHIVPVDDVPKITGALLEVFSHPARAHEQALQASAWMHEHLLSADAYIQELQSVWEQTARKK